ncbi:MAG: LytTR family transcriptional regulator, partial [Bacteroidaceae bacterium]|nr:LytTR family transcriptional regulator [Bacteroidaceae bacterium]
VLFKRIPKYLLAKRNQIIMVLFVSIFAVVFINVFKPFGSGKWMIDEKEIASTKYLLWSTILVFIGMTVVAISRVIMYNYSRNPRHSITYLKYAIWVFIELLLLSGAFTVLALIVSKNLNLTSNDPLEIYKAAMQNTFFIIGIPYFICIFYFSYQERSAKLKELMNENIGFKSSNLISIRDSRGVLQLSVAKENLLYIESADNYICIWYKKNDTLKKQLMHITMKDVSEQLAETSVVRCHRSYMINLDLVKVMRREKGNLFLELGETGVREIPISKTYGEAVLRRLVPIS